MADKSLQDQIADKRAEIAALEAQVEALRVAAMPQYPKHVRVPVPDQPDLSRTMLITVNTEAEEKAATYTPPTPKSSK